MFDESLMTDSSPFFPILTAKILSGRQPTQRCLLRSKPTFDFSTMSPNILS